MMKPVEKFAIIKVPVEGFVAKIIAKELAATPTIKLSQTIGAAIRHLPWCAMPELFERDATTNAPGDNLLMATHDLKRSGMVILDLKVSDHLSRYYQRWQRVELENLGSFFKHQAYDRLLAYLDGAINAGATRRAAVDAFYKKYELDDDDLDSDSVLRQYDRRKQLLA
jgi:hypothetical protein